MNLKFTRQGMGKFADLPEGYAIRNGKPTPARSLSPPHIAKEYDRLNPPKKKNDSDEIKVPDYSLYQRYSHYGRLRFG